MLDFDSDIPSVTLKKGLNHFSRENDSFFLDKKE